MDVHGCALRSGPGRGTDAVRLNWSAKVDLWRRVKRKHRQTWRTHAASYEVRNRPSVCTTRHASANCDNDVLGVGPHPVFKRAAAVVRSASGTVPAAGSEAALATPTATVTAARLGRASAAVALVGRADGQLHVYAVGNATPLLVRPRSARAYASGQLRAHLRLTVHDVQTDSNCMATRPP